jgi:hypothetical protein
MESPQRFAVRAYSLALRVAAGALLALAALSILDLTVGVLLDIAAPAELERVPLPRLVRRLLFCSVAPGAAYLVLRWLARAEVEVGAETVVIATRRARWEIPRAAIRAVKAWRAPWPGAGVDLVRAAGAPIPGLAMRDPTGLVAALGGATDAPALIAARTRRATRWLRHPLHALVLAPLVPTAIAFRLHQIIVAGSWLGEYHWYGLGRWLNTLFGVWLLVAGTMVCWYAAWRLVVALLAWPAARMSEPRALATRWLLECAAFIGYYGGVAWFLWSRLGQ